MKKILYSITLLFFTVTGFAQSVIKFDTVVIHKTAGPCEGNNTSFCFMLNITYPFADDTNKQLLLNNFITRKVIGSIITQYDSIPNIDSIPTVDSAIEVLNKKVFQDTLKNGIGTGKWLRNVNLNVIYQGNNYITFFLDYFEYMGGLHGLPLEFYYTINKKNFNQLTLSDVVTDTAKLSAIGEKLFRQVKHIPANISLKGAGFWFDTAFYVSQNFSIVKDTLISFYNEYKVLPGAGVGFELAIPFTAIADILKEPFKHEAESKVK